MEERIKKLEERLQLLEASASIPFDVEQAFRDRFRLGRLDSTPTIATSAKSANSEDVAVDEGGAGTYNVMNDPVGFIKINIPNDATDYHIPYFNA